MSHATSPSRRESILAQLQQLMAEAMPTAPSEADIDLPFLEMGANSLMLMDVQRTVEKEYGLTLTITQFFEELTTINELVSYIDTQLASRDPAPTATAKPKPEPLPAPALSAPALLPVTQGSASEIEAIFAAQMRTATEVINRVVQQQLQFLQGGEAIPHTATAAAPPPSRPTTAQPKSSAAQQPNKMLSPLEIRARGLTPTQQAHLESLIQQLNQRTLQSKQQADHYRSVLADSRASVGFRFTTKEILYPIVGNRSNGVTVWDIDGNAYLDISMGQGVSFFGHHPDFIDAALKAEGEEAIQMGPRPHNTGEAAALIAEMTGFERITFTNSGTEAVMAALRLARAHTGRDKIVMFEGAYHGHADSVMGLSERGENYTITTKPVSPGTPQGAVADLWVLPYDSEEALDFIRHRGAEIAAVIVEPIQSRNPKLQPRAFLHQLRQLTREVGALLIFDEMITGFRVHPRGAQGWFEVEADMATYGKLVGGGMPIGVVAGPAAIMDRIDGGPWRYGDNSYPEVNRVVFGGTFCQHPLAMSAVVAVMRYLKQQGPALQQRLNRMTSDMATELNQWFAAEEVPIEVVWFGSLFRFEFKTNLELLFYHLLLRGILIWEWRNYFLSTAHSEADVKRVIEAVKESVLALREGGFLPPKKGAREGAVRYPLSLAQQQLAALAQISPQGSMAYHVSPLLKLTGAVDKAALQQALQQVVARHPALRTTIDVVKKEQQINALELPLPAIDLRQSQAPEQAAAEWLSQHAQTRFDLTTGPLFVAHLLQLGERDYRLVLKGHHIIVDGLSMNLIVQELAQFYSAHLTAETVTLPQPLPFSAYLQWQQQQSFSVAQAYWLQQIDPAMTPLELPADRPEPTLKSYRGGRISRPIGVELLRSVKALSRAEGCTHFMTLLASYALWLHRLSGQSELLVGMPVAGRSLEGGESVVGYCTHLIPIRSHFEAEQPFKSYLRTIRTTLLQGYQHQDYPFSRLMESLALQRDGRHAPLVRALFNLDRPGEAPPMADLTVEWLSQPIYFTAFEVIFNLTELGEAMVLECDYNADRFEATTISAWLEGFLALLQGIVATPQRSVATLPLLSTAQWQRLIIDFNATEVPLPPVSSVIELFEAEVANAPAATALRWSGGELTYLELKQQADALAYHLAVAGVRSEAIVALCLSRSPTLVVAILAILKSGGAYLPLDPDYPPERLTFMLQDSGTQLLLSEQKQLARLTLPTGVTAVELDGVEAAWLTGEYRAPQIITTLDSLAYLIYTSGSTGRPKGTMLTQRGLVNYLSWAVAYYRTREGRGSPLHSSIGFDATITSLFTPLISGRLLQLLPEGGREIDSIRQALLGEAGEGNDWSLVKLTPAHLELLNALLPPEKLAGLSRYLVLGGEALLGKTIHVWRQHAPDTHIINEYGPTETVVGCCIYDDRRPEPTAAAVPIGRPIQNTRLYLLDSRLQPVAEGAVGELYIGGAGVARGYLGREALTAERFIDIANSGLNSGPIAVPQERLYRSGDLARMGSDGNLRYLGRVDNQIKLRGYRIELGEIEQALIAQRQVKEAVVVRQQRSEHDQRLLAYLVVEAASTAPETELRQALAQQLPEYMIPARFIFLPQLPLTPNGKVDRAALPQPTVESGGAGALLSPRSQAERQIVAIWSQLLERESIGVEQNFFEIGGHSLLVLPLSEQLSAQFNRSVEPVAIFQYPTVAMQARWLAGEEITASGGGQRKRRSSERRRQALGGGR
ncbi:amino acid adenylation domain-containing protein [Ectothiorhodospiraceae bacterium BW-2]|nr:amino acid adenylation domain-containing protein [Ectothiorhodospiraceae bacterium BW-2]